MLCAQLILTFFPISLVGDLNIDHKITPISLNSLILQTSFLLHQIVTTPTHFSYAGSPSLIDLVFLSCPQNLVSCCTISPLSNSDHMGLSIVCKLPTQFKRPLTPRRIVWCYSQGNFVKACELLQQLDWDNIFDTEDIDTCWEKWQTLFLNIMTNVYPKKLFLAKKAPTMD